MLPRSRAAELKILRKMLSSTSVMDRGIPTEAVLEEMRTSDREIFYLVGPNAARSAGMKKSDWICLGRRCASP